MAQSPSMSASVRMEAEVDPVSSRITLRWEAPGGATATRIYRRAPEATSWGTAIAQLPGTATEYVDADVEPGVPYEYKALRTGPTEAYGYIRSGIAVAEVERRGGLVLLVDSALAAALGPELVQLEEDLLGDGWLVHRHDVPADAPPVSVRGLIIADHEEAPSGVEAVYILGHVPVPYSGDIYPDGHTEHRGAWPCDAYYGDVDGIWTDATVQQVGGDHVSNHNVPGDGKWDQNSAPTPVELQVGRVDLSRLDVFPEDEVEVTRNYLARAHAWKRAERTVAPRAAVWDNLTWVGTPLAASGICGAAACVGVDSLFELNVFQGAFAQHWLNTDELISYHASTGLIIAGQDGVMFNGTDNGLTSAQLVGNLHGAVFNMSCGSYYGDWDNRDNFLRAMIASGNSLVHVWSGLPNWYIHHLAMGEPVGYCAKRSMNNTNSDYTLQNGGWQGQPLVRGHMALMGDPSLRMHYTTPPADLVATNDQWFMRFHWSPSPDEVDGYHIYRIDEAAGMITRITDVPVQDTAYSSGTVPFVPGDRYMVRAVRTVTTPSGSYRDLSLGALAVATGEPVADCAGVPGGPAIPGTPCDDGDPDTIGELYDLACACVEAPIGLEEHAVPGILAWPSPADRVLMIDLPPAPGRLVVRSSTGARVMDIVVRTERATIDTGNLPSGVYSVQYLPEDRTSAPDTFRFVVDH